MPVQIPSGQPAPMGSDEFKSQSQQPAVRFRVADLDPPSTLYVQRDDTLVLSLSTTNGTGETINVFCRLLLPNGFIQVINRAFTSLSSSPAAQLFSVDLAEGFLLSACLNCSAANGPGQTYCRLWVNRGKVAVLPRNSMELLIAGYVTVDTPVGWPYGVQQGSLIGPGTLTQGNVGSPAAGLDWSLPASTNTRTRVSSIAATLTTSATVANRGVQAQIRQGANILFAGQPNIVVPASTVATVSFSPVPSTSVAVATLVTVGLPTPCILLGNETIQIVTANLQAGDQWSNINFILEQWVDAG